MLYTELKPVLCEFIPETLSQGKLYISEKYNTAVHLCACGCGNKVVTPLKHGFWSMIKKDDLITLRPSIGSFNLPCKSHYFITKNKVEWL